MLLPLMRSMPEDGIERYCREGASTLGRMPLIEVPFKQVADLISPVHPAE